LILVIEDDDTTRETTARFLRLEGHTVRTAADGEEALMILRHERPSVIFCDLIMPKIDGWAFRRLQQQSPTLASIPFVVVSASLTVDDEAHSLKADMVLHKPVDIDDIVRCAKQYDRVSRKPGDGHQPK
jgi:two-component system, chemotaxis family, chemotaxis protein CheY